MSIGTGIAVTGMWFASVGAAFFVPEGKSAIALAFLATVVLAVMTSDQEHTKRS